MFQNPKTQYFNVDTTAELAFPCENAGMEPQSIRRRVDEVVEQFRLGPLMDRSAFQAVGRGKAARRVRGGLYARPAAVGAGRADEQPGRRRHRAAARYDCRDEAAGRDRCAGGAPPCLDHRSGGQVFLLCGGPPGRAVVRCGVCRAACGHIGRVRSARPHAGRLPRRNPRKAERPMPRYAGAHAGGRHAGLRPKSTRCAPCRYELCRR